MSTEYLTVHETAEPTAQHLPGPPTRTSRTIPRAVKPNDNQQARWLIPEPASTTT